MDDFLSLSGKNIVLAGVANKRSVAWATAKVLREAGANIIFLFKDQELLEKNRPLIGEEALALPCDVESEEEIARLGERVSAHVSTVDGFVHSLAFAKFSQGRIVPFHETLRTDFQQAMNISCFSFVQMCNALKGLFSPDASIVTMSISATRIASESYGYMGPIKAALDSAVVFLARSLAREVSPSIRVNAVGAGLLKTSASAGIPGYIDNYLYAEKVIPRKRALDTMEVANTIAFLLSGRSSGINAQTLVVDAGMSINYFDREIVRTVTAPT